jgi:dihydroorotase/N-acyl-D-amino-acid deacylase
MRAVLVVVLAGIALAGGCTPPGITKRVATAPDAVCPPASTAPPAPSTMPLDLVIANGRVVDGTGAPWFRADVGIAGGRIAAVGDLSKAHAARRIDVHGDFVAPGFIDMLGQSETFVLIDNRVESKIRQGITTEITGEGTASIAPMNEALIAEGRTFYDQFHLTIDWRDLAGYRRRFEANKSTINLGTYVGAGSVRAVTLGLGRVDPTPATLTEMEKAVDLAMEQGALGLSSALIYPPDSYAKTAELIALAKVAARHGGIYASHIRGERAEDEAAALDEAFTIAREAKIPVEIFHLKCAGKKNWGKMKDVVARIERARAEGLDVSANMYPYIAASNGLSANLPEWATDGGIDKTIARFHDPAQRTRIKQELGLEGGREDPSDILLATCVNDSLRKYMGKRLSQAAKEMNRSPEDALLDIVEQDRGQTGVVRFMMREDDVALGLSQPWVSLGSDNPGQATDGPFANELPHPRGFGAAARLIGKYARDEHLFSIEEAVRKMTSLPARRVRLADRGLLRPGMAADVTIFDPARIRDVATFEAPMRYSEGVDWVVVNGKIVLDDGKLTAERPGKFLTQN